MADSPRRASGLRLRLSDGVRDLTRAPAEASHVDDLLLSSLSRFLLRSLPRSLSRSRSRSRSPASRSDGLSPLFLASDGGTALSACGSCFTVPRIHDGDSGKVGDVSCSGAGIGTLREPSHRGGGMWAEGEGRGEASGDEPPERESDRPGDFDCAE